MSQLDALVRANPMPSVRPLAWVIIIVIAAGLIWASFVKLDEVAIAAGEVVPRGQMRVIQHLEGGIIQSIHVVEGDEVAAGEPLIQIALAVTDVNREEIRIRLDGLLLQRARLAAEASGEGLSLPADVAARLPAVARLERQTFSARRSELASTLSVLRSQIDQRGLEIRELEAKKKALATDLELAGENFAMSAELLEEGLTPKMEHLALEREMGGLKGEIETVDAAIPRARSALTEARERERELTLKFRREAAEEIAKVEVTIERTGEVLNTATDQAARTEIQSPIDGVVKNMRYHTIGGVVQGGEPIMEIVPLREDLVIEARLNPVDRGYVEVGQAAVVKISSYDFVRYGGLDGTVATIAPDATLDDSGEPYFHVVVRTDKSYLGGEAGELPITPGMQATVDIHTGEKTVLEYLIKPVLKLRHEAFRER